MLTRPDVLGNPEQDMATWSVQCPGKQAASGLTLRCIPQFPPALLLTFRTLNVN